MSECRALCIGIDAYEGPNRLSGCVNDAKAWAKFFKSQQYTVKTLLDEKATFDAIQDSISKLVESASSGDIVAIHYSGHGTRVPDRSADEKDHEDEAIVPHDFGTNGFIIDDVIGPILDKATEGVAINVFFDCCHSGGGTRLLAASGVAQSGDEKARFLPLTPRMIEVHRQAQRRRAVQKKRDLKVEPRATVEVEVADNVMREVLFAACQPSELALESNGNGHFTRAAMKVLGNGTRGLTNSAFLQRVIAEMGDSRRQTPQLSCAAGIKTVPLLTPVQSGRVGGTQGDSPPLSGNVKVPDDLNVSSGSLVAPVRSSRGSNVSSNRRSRMPATRSSSDDCLRNSFRVMKYECREGRIEVGGTGREIAKPRLIGRPFRGLSIPTLASERSSGTRVIFGEDNRLEVAETHSDPFGKICLLNFLTPNTPSGSIAVGTGWLIAPTVVITAGHCVYDGNWSSGMTVFPGVNDSEGNPVFAKAVRLEAVEGWTNSHADNCDFGAIFLDRPLDVGSFEFSEFSDADLGQMVVNVAGYPTDKPNRSMWMHSGRMLDPDDSFLHYRMDTHGGQSGCPVILWEDGNDFTVIGIHTGSVGSSNHAVRVSGDVFNQLMNWKDQT